MCNNTQKKKAAGAGKDFTLFFGVMLHFNFKCVKTLSTGLHKESTGPLHFSHFPFTGTRWMTSNQMSIYYYLFEQICTWVILELTADKRCRYQEKVYANEYKRATKQTISLVLKVHVPNQERISCPNPPKNGRSRTMDHSNYQRADGYSHHE